MLPIILWNQISQNDNSTKNMELILFQRYMLTSFLLHISNLKYFTIWWKCFWSIFVTHCLYFVVCNNKNLYKSIVESLSILHDAKYYLFLHYFKEKNAYHVCCLPKGRKFKPHNAMEDLKFWLITACKNRLHLLHCNPTSC